MARRVYPVPELVLDDYIRVSDTGETTEGSMDNTSRIMRVPLMDNPACRHVRAHEMAHAKFSPKAPMAPKGISQMIVQRVEDMRMNVHCRKQELHEAMDAPIVPGPTVWARLLTDDASKLTAGISTYATGDWKDWVRRSKASTDDLEFIESLWDEMESEPTWEQTQALSKRVSEYLDPSKSPDDGEGKPGDGEPTDLTGDILDEMVDESLEEEAEKLAMSPYERGLSELERANKLYGRTSSDASIVAATVVTMKLVRRMAPSKFKSRAKVPADRGMVPKYMGRYCTDKAIFAGRGKKRDHGGTILIDASGSMSIGSDDVDRAMEIAPLGTIATYSGEFTAGEIRIIAQKGKRAVGGLTPIFCGNLIDVAALEWMVKQPGPYYWVCDGLVSGGSSDGRLEMFSKNIFDRCIELVEKHGIIMVPDLESLPEIMRETI